MNIYEQIKNLFEKSLSIFLLVPQEADGDKLGSSLALFYTLKKLNKNVNLVLQNIPEKFKFLPIPEYLNSLDAKKAFTISLANIGGKVSEIYFNKDKEDLKIHFFSKEGDINEKDFSFTSQNLNPDLLIILGAKNFDDFGRIFKGNPQIFYDKPILNIDNNSDNEKFGEINLIDTNSSGVSEIVGEFLKECYERIPQRVAQLFVRADSGFFDGDLLDFLESRQSEYLIKVKMRNLVELLMSQTSWQREKGKTGIETVVFLHQCHGWKKAHRFVAIRKLVAVQTEGVFFPMPQYEFFCYVTNLPHAPWHIHKLYGQRATSENWISWCKSQMASGTIRTGVFWANSAIFQSCILAYNLMVWMMWLTSEKSFHEEPETIRSWFIHVPATVVTTARKMTMKLSEHYAFKQQWEEIEKSLSSLSFA